MRKSQTGKNGRERGCMDPPRADYSEPAAGPGAAHRSHRAGSLATRWAHAAAHSAQTGRTTGALRDALVERVLRVVGRLAEVRVALGREPVNVGGRPVQVLGRPATEYGQPERPQP